MTKSASKKTSKRPLLGCHLSISGGVSKSVERARELDCTAFQIFTSNPRGWEAAPLAEDDVAAFRSGISAGIHPVAHMPYLPNLAAPDPVNHRKSVATLIRELERCEILGIDCLVTHLGSHLGEGEEGGRRRIVEAIATALQGAKSQTLVLMENTAGTRNSLGTTPDDLARILDALDGNPRVGICIDTAHAFAAGYEWKADACRLCEELIGSKTADRVRVLHLNDSKVVLGGKADRHDHLGLGFIGLDGLSTAANHSLFRGLPKILETPVDDRRDDRGNLEVAWKFVKS